MKKKKQSTTITIVGLAFCLFAGLILIILHHFGYDLKSIIKIIRPVFL